MTYSSLRDFIADLEKHGQLVRVQEPVSPHLEMTEIGTRLIAEKGPAVLFEQVTGDRKQVTDTKKNNSVTCHPLPVTYTMPVLINLFGTVERIAFALGKKPHELRAIGEMLAFLKQPEPPEGWKETLSMLPLLKTAMAMKPKTVSRAPCQEVVLTGDDIDLGMLPIQGCWPGEPAPLITWPLIVTKGPGAAKEDNYNLGIYRL
jgi:4-hydroxy-3-polyprenylbenzoate decarboxylase